MGKKLTLYIDETIIERAKAYARNEGMSVSEMVQRYLTEVTQPDIQSMQEASTSALNALYGSLKLPQDFDLKSETRDIAVRKYEK